MLYIHAGAGKAGTTFLQAFFALNALELNIQYPQIGRHSSSDSLDHAHHRLALNYYGVDSLAEWVDLCAYIRNNDPLNNSNWLVSTENLFYASEQFLKSLYQLLTGFCIDFKFLLVARDPFSYARSVYLQYSKQGRSPVFHNINDFLCVHLQSVRVDQLMQKFIDISHGNVTLIDYNKCRENDSLLADFLKAMNASLEHECILDTTSQRRLPSNPSLNQKSVVYVTLLTECIEHGLVSGQSELEIFDNYLVLLQSASDANPSVLKDELLKDSIKRMISSSLRQKQSPHGYNLIQASEAFIVRLNMLANLESPSEGLDEDLDRTVITSPDHLNVLRASSEALSVQLSKFALPKQDMN